MYQTKLRMVMPPIYKIDENKTTKMYHLIKNSFSYLTLNKNNYPRDKSSIFQQKTAKPFESVLSQINYTVNTGNNFSPIQNSRYVEQYTYIVITHYII